jgi:hypothetical protein
MESVNQVFGGESCREVEMTKGVPFPDRSRPLVIWLQHVISEVERARLTPRTAGQQGSCRPTREVARSIAAWAAADVLFRAASAKAAR